MSQITPQPRSIESRARRAARRAGLSMRRSRERDNVPNLDNFGNFMLVDTECNCVVAGMRYDLTAEDVLAWVAKLGA